MSVIEKEEPAVITLNLKMHDISDLEELRSRRGERKSNMIPLVVVAAKTLPADIRTNLEVWAWAYPTKPISYLDLKRVVEKELN
jgi:CheY-like chemotaxis protein